MNGLALCAGIGGLELGLKLALGESYRTVCYVEREAFCAATLVARMEDKALDRAPIWDDLATFDGRAWRGKVDFVSAGYPCQPFSRAARGRNPHPNLWNEVARIITESSPEWVFLENVIRADNLEELGFICKSKSFSAASLGAPHIRSRVFVLGRNTNYQSKSTMQFNAEMAGLSEFHSVGRTLWAEPSDNLRVAYGAANWVDRLRALGNGVVPLVAAHAFCVLSTRMKKEAARKKPGTSIT